MLSRTVRDLLIFFILFFSPTVYSSDEIAMNCSHSLLNTMKIFSEIEAEVKNFHPSSVIKSGINYRDIVVSKPKEQLNGLNVEDVGTDGDIRFGMYNGNDVVIKFFKKESFANVGVDHTRQNFESKIKQGFFVLSLMNKLALGPKGYGYIVGSDVEALAQASDLVGNDYYGAIIMQKIDIKKQYKKGQLSDFKKDEIKIIKNELKRIGIIIDDLDYVISANNQFYFIDFDFWMIKNDYGIWRGGSISNWDPRLFGY